MNSKKIPIFFATDDNYVPYLAVTIQSLLQNASSGNKYCIYVLNEGLKKENKKAIKCLETKNVHIKFKNITRKIEKIRKKLADQLRDYYSLSIYYRIFIATMFPKLKKAIYLDCDIILLDDIANLYNKDLGNNLVGAIVDEVASSNPEFISYVENAVGINHEKYFNSGVLLMNLEEMRNQEIEKKFAYYLNNYPFSSMCPDQDYLNFLCKGQVLFIEKGWDKMTVPDDSFNEKDLHLIHYNMFKKPWKYDDVMFQDYFWYYAKQTIYHDMLLEMRNNYSNESKQNDLVCAGNMITYAMSVVNDPNNFYNTIKKEEHERLLKKLESEKSDLEDIENLVTNVSSIN